MISVDAIISNTTVVGNYVTIGKFVKIGALCHVGNNVVIYPGTIIGDGVRIDDHAVIGKQPMKALTSAVSSSEEQPPCTIGNSCIIGTGAVIYANAVIGQRCLIADYATVRENVFIGESTIIGRGVAIENYCKVGHRCKLETNAYITAYSEVGDDCFIAPGVVTSNDNYAGRDIERFNHFKGVIVENGGRIGAQATILPGKVIGKDSMVGAGSVVSRDVPEETVVQGNPAKQMRKVPEAQLLRNQ